MRRIGFILLLTCATIASALADGITVQGRILEASKEPLANANVRLTNAQGKLQGGMATDTKGGFRIANIPAGTYTLEVSFVGFVSHKQQLKLQTSKPMVRLDDITLAEDGKLLGDVVVVGKATEVVVKGDTIEYNAGSFKTTEGAALEELIKKLPGAAISESGEITINGKSVSQIMVDGKRFFESDPKVAIKNLPAELIDKVQVLDRESDAARMTGFADGDDETVINLTIKSGRKKGLFGTLYAGAGTKERYEANGMINRFTDGKQWTILGGSNNTNNAGFSDIAADLSRSDIAQQASGSSRRPFQRDNSGDGITTAHILGGNLALTIDTRTEVGGNAFLGNSDKETTTRSETTNIETTGNLHESATTTELNKKYNVGTNLRLNWKPDAKTEVIISPQLSYGTGKGTYVSEALTTLETTGATVTESTLTQTTDSRVYTGRVHLDASRKLSDAGRTLALTLNTSFNGEDTEGQYHSDIYTASTATSEVIDQRLANDNSTKSFRARLNWVEPLGKGYALQLNYQLRGEFRTTERTAFDADASGAYTIANADYSYGFESSFLSHRAGIALKKATKVMDLTAGVNVDPSHLISETMSKGTTQRISQRVVNFSPTLRFSYKPSRALNLRLDYRGQSFQPSSNQLAPIQDATNPLVLYVGNPDLKPGYRHNLMGHLSLFSAEKQSSLNLFAMGRVVQNEIVSTSVYDASTGVRTIGYTNVNGSWMASLGGFFTMPLPGKRFSLRLSSRNALTNQVGFISGERNNARGLSLSESLSLGYRHGRFDMTLRGDWTFYKVDNSIESRAGQATRDYGIGWDATVTLPLDLILESQLSYTTTSGYAEGYNREQTLLNLSLSYSFLKGKAASLRFKVYDVLGQKRNIYRNVSALAISSQETNTLGQYAMLHFIYRFNSFSGNATAADMKQTDMRGGPGGPPPGRF